MTSWRVCFPFVGETIGGSHISTCCLIKSLPPDKVVPSVVVHREGPLTEYLRQQQISYETVPPGQIVERGNLPWELTRMLQSAPKLARFLRSHSIDIVHTNDARMHLTWGLAARLAGARFIWHQRSPWRSRRAALYSRLADEVVTVSHFCKSEFHGTMRRRARVVINPVEPLRIDRGAVRQRLLEAMAAPAAARIVGFVGNLTAQKRPLIFVETAARLFKHSAQSLYFPMFGQLRPPMHQEVLSLIEERGLNGRCILMGMRHPIEPWIAACDILVAPGFNEAFGRTVVEAQLVGTPIVAADHGGHQEILRHGETGFLVTPDDPAAFVEAVVRLLENPETARRVAEVALESAGKRFSAKRHVEEILKIYANQRLS